MILKKIEVIGFAFLKLFIQVEYKNKYPISYNLISRFRNNRFITYNTDVNSHLLFTSEFKGTTLSEVLKYNPGYFARSLDYLIRRDENHGLDIINTFNEIIDKISTPLLINLIEHFTIRKTEKKTRDFYY